jgi:CubicO group peptidase (beta-lactamase class C family)
VPGLSLAVARGKDMIVAKGYGFARLEDSVPATELTTYPIASVTKQMTAAAVLKLAEQNRLKLKDHAAQYLEYPPADEPMTLRHLLGHTSGLPVFDPLDGPMPRGEVRVEDVVTWFRDHPPEVKPGERFIYSNAGYYLLGRIIERVSGRPYAAFLADALFQPAGMTATGDCAHAKPTARGYTAASGSFTPVDSQGPGYAAAGLCSSVVDLVSWMRALRDRKVINRLSWLQMTEPVELRDGSQASYGLGVSLWRLERHRVVGHGGAHPGYSSHIAFYPDADLIVAVLANTDEALTRRLSDRVARRVLGLVEPKVKDVTVSLADLARYEGTYDLQGQPMRVFTENGRLRVAIGGGAPWSLLYQGSHEFAAEHDPAVRVLFFVSGPSARALEFRSGELDLRAARSR